MEVGARTGWHWLVGLGIKVLKHSSRLLSRVCKLRRWFMERFRLGRALCALFETRLGAFERSFPFG